MEEERICQYRSAIEEHHPDMPLTLVWNKYQSEVKAWLHGFFLVAHPDAQKEIEFLLEVTKHGTT